MFNPTPFRRRASVWFRPSFIALSPAARSALDLADASLRILLDRHERGDWGLVNPDTARENEWALMHHDTLWSLFELPTGERLVLATDPTRTITSGFLEIEPANPLRASRIADDGQQGRQDHRTTDHGLQDHGHVPPPSALRPPTSDLRPPPSDLRPLTSAL